MWLDAPLWSIVCLPLAVYLWRLGRRSYAQLSAAARWQALGLRGTMLGLLVAALAQPVVARWSPSRHLVCLLDVSKSVSADNLKAALADFESLVKRARHADRDTLVSVVAFGGKARLLVSSSASWTSWAADHRERVLYQETLPSLQRQRTELIASGKHKDDAELAAIEGRIESAARFQDEIAGDRTDVDGGLRLALNCGAKTGRRTVYVFTDARFNRGGWQEAWTAADRDGAAVHVVRLDRPQSPEVAVAGLVLPPKVRINEGFTARIRVASNVATFGELAVFKNGYLVERREVAIAVGENDYEAGGLYFREKGFHSVDVVIRAQTDTVLENNRRRVVVVVPGPVRVLYVDKDDAQIPYLKNALELEGMEVDARPAGGLPRELSELLGFDALVLSNVSADRLSAGQMRSIRTYVEDFGGGFIMLGGEESFGLGGYFGTPVEEILPVRMPIPKDLNRPSLALVLVIDKSGSMEGAKIQLAKRAAIETADVVNPRDQIGLIGFDSAAKVILELTGAGDRATIAAHVAELAAGGGTFMYPALEAARDCLGEINARRKHVIVLSDGQTEGQGYEELVRGMAADGVTLSAVGIGDGADMNLLEAMAQAGGGQAYFTNDFQRIPQIFTREALRASKSMLVERLVQVSVIAEDVSLKDIDAGELPLLSGYVATTTKEQARLIIVSDSGDPILARWRYGLGQTIAFTSETKPRWAEDWLDWPDFAKFWSQLVRSVTAQGRATSVEPQFAHRLADETVVVSADVRAASGDFVDDVSIEASLVDQQGRKHKMPVRHAGPGLFEVEIPTVQYGRPQQMVWTVREKEGEAVPTPYGFAYSFSPEFSALGVDEDTLGRIAARRCGETMSVGRSELVLGGTGSHERVALWPYLLGCALSLVPLDILRRRLG